jgi:hypothetical protein
MENASGSTVTIAQVAAVPYPPRSPADYRQYQKVLGILFIWLAAVIVVVSMIDGDGPSPVWQLAPYDAASGYTKSLLLLLLPLVFLVVWYVRSRDALQLRIIMKAVLRNVLASALVWIILDIFLANLLFQFPNNNAHVLPLVWGYSWTGQCTSLWTLFNLECYPRNIPLEEFLFYLGGAALLTMMYMWSAEDFFAAYSLPRKEYEEEAKKVGPLVKWNKTLIALGLVVLVTGIIVKKLAPWHSYHEGWPYYFFAELLIVFVPLTALYTQVRRFTNNRAFLFVIVLHILVSLVWEGTLALPYGWWNYHMPAMIGVVAVPWSKLAIEACGLWLTVAWAVMFTYEATKIKALSGRSWPEVLCGKRSWWDCLGFGGRGLLRSQSQGLDD